MDTPSKLYLVLELGSGGDLYDFLRVSPVTGVLVTWQVA